MSDKGRRAATQPKGSSKAAADGGGETFSARLTRVAGEIGSLVQDAGGIRSLENQVDERLALREEVQRKEIEIERMKTKAVQVHSEHEDQVTRLEKEKTETKSTLDLLLAEFGTRYKTWAEATTRYETESDELSRLRPRLAQSEERAEKLSAEIRGLRDELERLVAEIKEQRDSNETLRSRLQRRQLKLSETQGDLEKCRAVLIELRENLGVLPFDKEQVAKDFDELSDKVHQLAWQYFNDSLPNPSALIGGLQPPLSQIPQPSTNSSAARLMRVALAEAIITQELSGNIFQEFHNLKTLTGIEQDTLAKVVDTLAKTYPLQATIVRCQLTKVCSSSSDRAAIPALAAERVATVLGAWFGEGGSEPQRQPFLEKLATIFSDAMDLWERLQRSPQKITTRTNVFDDSWFDDDKRDAYDDANDGTRLEDGRATSTIVIPMAILFPRILADHEDLFHGYALFHTQPAVVAAARETTSLQDRQGLGALRRRRASKDEARPGSGRRLSSASVDTVRYKKPPSSTPSELSHIEAEGPHLAQRRVSGSAQPKFSATE